MLRISNRLSIPLKEIELKALLSQGSGGQHVNKTSTAIQLFFDVRASSLPEPCKESLLSLSDSRLTADGVVVIRAQEFRSQEKNREAALERLKQLVASVLVSKKQRHATKPTRGSRERRLAGKQMRSRTKAGRKRVRGE